MVFVFALPALAPVVIAVAVMLLLWALAIILVKPLMVVLGALPYIGSQAAQAIENLAGLLSDFVANLVNSQLQAATNMIDWLSGNATMAIRWATAAATWLGVSLRATVGAMFTQLLMLTNQVRGILAHVASVAAQVAGLLTHVAALAIAQARILAVAIPTAATWALNTAVARATAALTAARLALTAAISFALSTALRAVGLEAAARAANDLAVRSWAQAMLAAQAATFGTALAHLTVAVNAEVGQLGRTIGQVDAKIGAIAAPTVAIAIGTIATELTTLRRQCIDPMCNFLGPELRALELVGDVAMLAAVTELVAAAVRDPRGAAASAIEDSRPLIGGAAGLLSDLTGLSL